MPNDEYKIHTKSLEEVDFTILIIEYPRDDIEDKLTYLSKEKGNINKNHFEDFVIAHATANINQLLSHINSLLLIPPDLMRVRSEILDAIYEVNPLFNPEKLIINNNHVIKVRKANRIKNTEKPLTGLKNWESSYYEGKTFNDTTDSTVDKAKAAKKKSSGNKKGKDPNTLPYTETKQWWRRINQYIKVKQFNPEDAENILKNRYFHNRTSFATFIVSVCVIDFEELFNMLDNMGIPKKVAPPVLIHELYELCRTANGFLTFDNAQTLAEADPNSIGNAYESPSVDGHPKTHTAGQSMRDYASKRKGRTSFKEVPKEDLLKLADNMKIFIVGQDAAVDKLAEAVQRASVGLKDPAKPIGSFLFAGRTGVGKTLATKVLADELIKGRDNMVTIDCSEYSADHEYAKLIGSPAGYIGHEQGGMLTNAIAKNPFSIVVFDEIEKASHKVHELLLQVLEEGRLTDGKGNTVSFKDAIIIMTSNVGVSEVDGIKNTVGFGDVAKVTDDKKDKAIKEALKKKFKPEFLNRIDEMVFFKNLTKKDYMRIIDIELYKLVDNLKSNDTEYKTLELKFKKPVGSLVYKEGIDEKYGARPLKRCIESIISTPLAKELLSSKTDPRAIINVDVYKGKIKFEIKEKVDVPPFYMTDEHHVDEDESATFVNNGE
jgi:ATP-dependent protease Clp ATPase subunit